jgi:UDP-N-acetylmuramyl pentapeptide phosphotransferase/UDP-N-acetylglucosamine-1-phosphate transferase
MNFIFTGFFISAILCHLIIRYQRFHSHFTADPSIGTQKFHELDTPRVGGLAIYISLIMMWLTTHDTNHTGSSLVPLFLICLPVFIMGLLEDVTKKVGVKLRLIAAMGTGVLAFIFCDAKILRIDIPFIDQYLSLIYISAIFSIVAIAGLSNAYNLIDGFNGLASMVGIIALSAIAYIALQVGDQVIMFQSLAMIAALLGFFIWNYPRGLIFLGDGGAYLVGSYIAILSVLLVFRHQEISPWFALMVNAYPITETLFTIFRRLIFKRNPGLPDATHLHTLIYRQIMRWRISSDSKMIKNKAKNSATSPYLWALSLLGVFPAIIFWHSTTALICSAVLYYLFYIAVYQWLIHFRRRRRRRALT